MAMLVSLPEVAPNQAMDRSQSLGRTGKWQQAVPDLSPDSHRSCLSRLRSPTGDPREVCGSCCFQKYIYIYTYIYIYISKFRERCTHTHIHKYIHIHTCAKNMYKYIYIYKDSIYHGNTTKQIIPLLSA